MISDAGAPLGLNCRNCSKLTGVSRPSNFCNSAECLSMTTAQAGTRRRRHRPGAGRPSKGARIGTYALLPNHRVHDWVKKVSQAYNNAPLSQVVADLVSKAAGHPELVRDLNVGSLALVLPGTEHGLPLDLGPDLDDSGPADVEIFTRLPEVVWEWVCDMADAHDATLKQIVGDVVSIAAGELECVRKLNQEPQKEALPLAI